MKKEYRLKKNEDFSKVIKKKNSVGSRNFILYINQNELSHLRVGISVSKKLGKAVVRNKIKRQVRMMVKDNFNWNQNYDIIVIVRKNYLDNSYKDNKKDLSYLYRKILKKVDK